MSIVPLNTQEILQDIIRLDTSSIEELASNLDSIIEKRKQKVDEENEQQLIDKVHQTISTENYKRYQELSQKLRLESITTEEHEELLVLIQKIEASNIERLEHLTTLARLRNISLREVMEQLGLIVKN